MNDAEKAAFDRGFSKGYETALDDFKTAKSAALIAERDKLVNDLGNERHARQVAELRANNVKSELEVCHRKIKELNDALANLGSS